MIEEGKYLYCIIESNEGRNFGPMGIGGEGNEVTTVGYQDLSAVISHTPTAKYVISRENLVAHQKVIEKVMNDYTVLPVRFCTIASSTEEIRNLLRKRYSEFKNLLKDMDNKIELGLRAWWKNIDQIFAEIVNEDSQIKKLNTEIKDLSGKQASEQKIKLGKMIRSTLEAKKKKEKDVIVDSLKKLAFDYKINPTQGDKMLLNAAFLVDRLREKEFDYLMEELIKKYQDRIQFKYVGPIAPYNFVNIVVKWTSKD